MKKKSIALGLALALCVSLFPATAQAAEEETDVVAAAPAAGLLVYFAEDFSPELDGKVTRMDVAKVMAAAGQLPVENYTGNGSHFTDMSAFSAEEVAVVETICDNGIMAGKNDGSSFSPEDSVRRGELTKVLHQMLYYCAHRAVSALRESEYLSDVSTQTTFSDIGSHWAEKYIKILYNLDIIAGEDEYFFPDRAMVWGDLLTWSTNAKVWATTSPDSPENLPPLTAVATDLQWGVHRWKKTDGTVETWQIPGYFSAQMGNEGHQNSFQFLLYRQREAKPVGSVRVRYNEKSDKTYIDIEDFLRWTSAAYENGEEWEQEEFIDSGSYYFTVKAIGDGTKYRDGEESQPSAIFKYQKPSRQLVPPTKLWWDGTTMRIEDTQDFVSYYDVDIWYSETETNNIADMKHIAFGPVRQVENVRTEGVSLSDEAIQEGGVGYYYFRVCTWSADVNQYQGSDWSELSPAYHLTDIPTKDSLSDILTTAEGKTGEEIRQAVQELNTGDLKTALLADKNEAGGTADLLSQLEEKTGLTVNTAAEKPEFEDMAANTKIVGAALNDVPEGTDTITLNIGAPQEEHVIPEQYHNTVALSFGMGLDGVVDQENLKVPVRITLPIPSTINHEFLVLLHYGQDGKVEEITRSQIYIFQKDGKWYASFVLTHFSDFVLTELKQETPTPTPTPSPKPSGGGSSGGGGGSSAPATYSVVVPAVSNGKVELSPKSAQRGDTVTLTVTPDKGYKLDSITVTDNKGKAVNLTDLGDGKYTFSMPASKVEVKARFTEEAPTTPPPVESQDPTTPVTARFADVKPGDWYVDAVQYVCDRGLMEGVSQNTFLPGGTLTRGAIVTILHRMEGSPAGVGRTFQDVPAGQWYTNGVLWASSKGLVNGFGDGTFRPEDPVTREQLVTILYRYTAWKGQDTTARASLSLFMDEGRISAYAKDAMAWAKAMGLISGHDWGGLDPQKEATRAQIAVILQRFCETVVK